MDDFLCPALFGAVHADDVDPRWTSPPDRIRRLRLLLWIVREASRDHDVYLVGSRGAKAILGWDPQAPRNDAAVRDLLKKLGGGGPQADWLYNIDRYSHPRSSWAPYRSGKRVTGVSEVRLPQTVWEAAEQELERGAVEPLVHIATGRGFNSKRDQPPLFARASAAAHARRPDDIPAKTERLIDYLHSRPVRAFSTPVESARDGLVIRARGEKQEGVRRAALRSIRSLRVQPVPVYTSSSRTQRVFSHGDSMATAPRWIRRAVLNKCVEVDMTSAQLALAASLWDAPKVRSFLGKGLSYWESLSDWLAVQFPNGQFDRERDAKRLKKMLKVATYGVAFGMEEENVARWGNPHGLTAPERKARESDFRFLRRAFGVAATDIGAQLLHHPLMAELLGGRDIQLTQIEAAGDATDVFGRRYVLGQESEGRPVTARSALAGVVQAAEHYVMLGAAEVFIREAERAERAGPRVYPEADILLWQYDGFTMRVRQRARAKRWIHDANEGLQAACRDLEHRLGCPPIHTRLSVDYAPDGVLL